MDALPPVSGRVAPLRPGLGALLARVAVMAGNQRAVVLQVVAARHGEGTTTVARELAASHAPQNWSRVALVDASALPADCTLPALAAFGRGEAPVLRPGRLGGEDVALARLTGPGEGTPRLDDLRALFAWMRSQYTVTVVDCPPILPCLEAELVGAVADGTLLVVEAERTRRAELVKAREMLEQLGATMLGTVLNKRRPRLPRLIERFL